MERCRGVHCADLLRSGVVCEAQVQSLPESSCDASSSSSMSPSTWSSGWMPVPVPLCKIVRSAGLRCGLHCVDKLLEIVLEVLHDWIRVVRVLGFLLLPAQFVEFGRCFCEASGRRCAPFLCLLQDFGGFGDLLLCELVFARCGGKAFVERASFGPFSAQTIDLTRELVRHGMLACCACRAPDVLEVADSVRKVCGSGDGVGT